MRSAFPFYDTVYLSELDLFRAEGATAKDVVPCMLPDALPRNIFIVDDGPPILSMAEAMDAMCPGSRMVMLSIDSNERLYH